MSLTRSWEMPEASALYLALSTDVIHGKEYNLHSEDLFPFPWIHDKSLLTNGLVQTGPPTFARRGAIYHKVACTARDKMARNATVLI